MCLVFVVCLCSPLCCLSVSCVRLLVATLFGVICLFVLRVSLTSLNLLHVSVLHRHGDDDLGPDSGRRNITQPKLGGVGRSGASADG